MLRIIILCLCLSGCYNVVSSQTMEWAELICRLNNSKVVEISLDTRDYVLCSNMVSYRIDKHNLNNKGK